jgi:hypothetical protein
LSDTTTSYETQCDILADLWLEYKNHEQFQDFFQYNDLGLPLAYCIASKIVPSSETAEIFIGETFDLLLAARGIEDTGFSDLEELLGFSGWE